VNADGVEAALRELGLLATGQAANLEPLSGGVSADVFAMHSASGQSLVVKRAIPCLRVTVEWRAPTDRDTVEVAFLRTVGEIAPGLVPGVLAWSHPHRLFVMPRIAGPVWKQELAAGRVNPAFAADVGRALARIHTATAGQPDLLTRFPDPANFEALRVEPFLLYPASQHPDVAARLTALAENLREARTALIWGDASPKNILVGEAGPVFLDAETAAMGDPAFDVAFCLTHLLLKTIWLARNAAAIMGCFAALRDAYLAGVDFAAPLSLSARAASLTSALLLARVDGRSPAGYLDRAQEAEVRRRAKALLARTDLNLETLPAAWAA
jgi:aminoglycoside phosphotransferase (APT) family kinase protein